MIFNLLPGYTHFLYDYNRQQAQLITLFFCNVCTTFYQENAITWTSKPIEALRNSNLQELGSEPRKSCKCPSIPKEVPNTSLLRQLFSRICP